MTEKYKIHMAPLQGYTEDTYRRLHAEQAGGVDTYYTPFIRLEHGQVRQKDMRDALPEHNAGVNVVPQIIARDGEELETALAQLAPYGYKRVDLNMGCPFPLQTRHGRGAAVVGSEQAMRSIAEVVKRHEDIAFSAKMRLGLTEPTEWLQTIDILNDMPLVQLAVHPRVAVQQYKGVVDMEQMDAIAERAKHALVYNGDLLTVSDIERIGERYGERLSGVMIGRGLLARPSLAREYGEDAEWTDQQVVRLMLNMHQGLMEHYERVIPGEAQRLQKVRTFWDHAEPLVGRKTWKKLMKAGNMKNYMAAVAGL